MEIQEVLKILDEKKAVNIAVLETNPNKLSDSCIVASGTSSRHMQSVADCIYKYLKSENLSPKIEGNSNTGWILVEADGTEVHLFKPELREYYDLEGLLGSKNTQDVILPSLQ
ncbi:MAG: ribosome silencing factor [Holosporales bacterium]|jgi:ribosome-associated protein|nr:ribosome silencing factor [Holosporales bacterium]